MKSLASQKSRYRAAVRASVIAYNEARRPFEWHATVPRLPYHNRKHRRSLP